jgi:transposase
MLIFVDCFHSLSWHTRRMIDAALADLESLDKETLKALLIRERRSNAQQIEHLKLVIEKYRRMLFGTKSEKLAGELEQLELQLE